MRRMAWSRGWRTARGGIPKSARPMTAWQPRQKPRMTHRLEPRITIAAPDLSLANRPKSQSPHRSESIKTAAPGLSLSNRLKSPGLGRPPPAKTTAPDLDLSNRPKPPEPHHPPPNKTAPAYLGLSNRLKSPDPRRPESQKEAENKDEGAGVVEITMPDLARPLEANSWQVTMEVAKRNCFQEQATTTDSESASKFSKIFRVG